ncbi:Protein CBR-PAQR-1 [Caenorhabditis briggsae]|uniref:Progestin and adipoQ receptor-like protein 1 n=1 Tax=Caenorhabditis briggsae TaxID=6238 RepID=ADRL_CAEBR|nr:Protein CBR-PAQR-1 [Caenorhabditis briggsae]A8WZU4.2 RecName: Full=Progestin and adipoQ receptor-like protein 1 [Caenorhabditis briggsae]CAP25904.2 Protein CBR-PAQR-1 [Caenorhabditis briggsae]
MDPDEVNQALGHYLNDSESGELVVEDSTTVQVTNPEARKTGDKIEVYYSRKTTVVSPTNSDDEEGEFCSDSELLPAQGGHRSRATSFAGRVRAGSDDEMNPKHTVLRYRRKKGGQWREVNAQGTPDKRKDDEDELEVDVKEDRSEQTGIVTKTYEARWKVLKYEHLPEWLQDNEFLRHGHRPPLPSFAECFKSIWSLHTETGNIWTHLIGCVAFFLLACWFLTRPDNHIQFQEKVVFSFFFAGAVSVSDSRSPSTPSRVIRSTSSRYSANSTIWESRCSLSARLFQPKITYIAMVCVLGIGAIVVSLWDKFSESKYRPVRAAVFVGMGCSGVIPTIHYIITDGVHSLFADNSFHWLLLMAFLYLLGAALYATRTPERFFPGKCDIWFQSHQLFHTCVVIAAFVHYYGISEMAFARLNEQCPVR